MDRVAWSRSGFLAFIVKGRVRITWLRCIDGENWQFVPSVDVPVSSDSEPVHLSWSTSNYDLAITDALGRIQITTVSSSATVTNHIVGSAAADTRPRPSERDAVLATHWLGLEKNMVVPTAESKPESRPWETVRPLGPFHPINGKGALVCVNGNGMLRMLVQKPDQHYTEIDAVMPGAEAGLSYAAFAPNGPQSLLVVTYSPVLGLVVYETHVTWHAHQLPEKAGFVDLTVRPIASYPVLNTAEPLTSLTAHRPQPHATLEIRAVAGQTVWSWALQHDVAQIHTAFMELILDPSPTQKYDRYHLQLRGETEDAGIMKVVVTELLLMVVYESGRLRTESLVPSDKVQFDKSGLEFPASEIANSLALCFSPNAMSAALFKSSDQMEPTLLRLQNANQELSTPTLNRIGATLAMRYAHTVFNSVQCDDMLSVCWSLIHHETIEQDDSAHTLFNILASETQRLLNVSFLAPEDSRRLDRVVAIPSPLQRWLALRMSIGTSKGWKRNSGCQLSWTLLNIQILAFSLTWTSKKLSQRTRTSSVAHQQAEIESHCFHLSNMLGLVRWLTDIIARICQELQLADAHPQAPGKEGAESYLLEEANVWSSLLLSSISRLLFKFSIRAVRALVQASANLASLEKKLGGRSDTAKQTHRRLVAMLQTAPVPLDQFEKLVSAINESLHKLYTDNKLDQRARFAAEAVLLRDAKVPSVYAGLLPGIIQLYKLHIRVNAALLYAYDVSWLSIDTPPSDDVDIIRKRIILPEDIRQRCTRCGMLSVIESPKLHGLVQWTLLFQRFCLCGGSWLPPS